MKSCQTFPNKINAFAGEDDFDNLFLEPVKTSERREINTDEHGQVVDPTSEPSVRRLVTHKKVQEQLPKRKMFGQT